MLVDNSTPYRALVMFQIQMAVFSWWWQLRAGA